MSTSYGLSTVEFNVREITKQLLLLEDHLFDKTKRCKECIRKHLMMIEAFAEEANSLDSDSNWFDILSFFSKKSRDWMIKLTDGADTIMIAKEIRSLRKAILKLSYDPRKLGDPSSFLS
jgi:hypothetical protein